MNGATLKTLARVADLARLDLEAAAVQVRCKQGEFRVSYSGAYAGGWRTEKVQDVDDFSISVNANRFKVLVGMFSDEDSVAIKRIGDTLTMDNRVMRVNLKKWGQPGHIPGFKSENVEFSARLSASALLSELDAAGEFTSDSYSKQSLTGIKLDFDSPTLRVSAFDGFGALFESDVKAKVSGAKGSIVVPKDDFVIGARLVGDTDAIIAKQKGEGCVYVIGSGSKSLFRSSLFAVDWPDVTPITGKRNYVSTFNVDTGQIRNLIAGAKALDTGRDVDVTSKGKSIEFVVRSELGDFSMTVKGNLPTPLKYDRDALGKVIKLGPVLEFNVPNKAHEPTRIVSDYRRCWIVTRV